MKSTVGLHVAVIMDGNGRWATSRGLPRIAGHHAGVASVRRVVERAVKRDIRQLTLYAFSSDNWQRPTSEVQGIFGLLRTYLRKEVGRLCEQRIQLQIIGRRDRLGREVLAEIERAESLTQSGSQLRLCIAIDYSSRNAISRAANRALAMLRNGEMQNQSGDLFAAAMAAESRDVDLLIRTGGEKRLSDFLLWESAYAELVFTDRMWPDFDGEDLDAALGEFSGRERRFGGLKETSSSELLTGT